MKLLSIAVAASLAAVPITSANAAVFIVDALGNSSTGGAPLSTVSVLAGQVFTVTASTSDLWSAGDLPRLSDANGLVVNRIAQSTDDSGPRDGLTQITGVFVLWTQDGFTAPFASLVGRVGTQYQVLGTNFSGSFSQSGVLQLFFWDQNNGDNTGNIAANITIPQQGAAVPEPGTWMMMLLGFGGIGLAVRRRRPGVVARRV